jgi:hypothetical protein
VCERGHTDDGDSYYVIQAGGSGIGQGFRGDEYLNISGIMSRETALLIAAAPEMYEALRAVVNWEAPSCWKKVTAALKRAQGEAITGMESAELDASEFVTDPKMSLEPKTQSPAIMLLKQDVSHAAKIREHVRYESRLEGLLQLASRVLLNGDEAERVGVAKQIQALLDAGLDPA